MEMRRSSWTMFPAVLAPPTSSETLLPLFCCALWKKLIKTGCKWRWAVGNEHVGVEQWSGKSKYTRPQRKSGKSREGSSRDASFGTAEFKRDKCLGKLLHNKCWNFRKRFFERKFLFSCFCQKFLPLISEQKHVVLLHSTYLTSLT